MNRYVVGAATLIMLAFASPSDAEDSIVEYIAPMDSKIISSTPNKISQTAAGPTILLDEQGPRQFKLVAAIADDDAATNRPIQRGLMNVNATQSLSAATAAATNSKIDNFKPRVVTIKPHDKPYPVTLTIYSPEFKLDDVRGAELVTRRYF